MTALCNRTRNDVARRQLVCEAVAAVIEKQRTLAAQSLRQQKAVVDESGRVELHELQICKRCPGAVGKLQPVATGTRRVRRSLPECRISARGQHRRRRSDRTTIGEDSGTAPCALPELEHPDVVEERDPRMKANTLGEYSGDRPPGLRPSGMDDAPHGVASLAAKIPRRSALRAPRARRSAPAPPRREW